MVTKSLTKIIFMTLSEIVRPQVKIVRPPHNIVRPYSLAGEEKLAQYKVHLKKVRPPNSLPMKKLGHAKLAKFGLLTRNQRLFKTEKR